MYRVRGMPRVNKYRNISTVYNGRQYHSKKEAQYASELDLRKKANDIREWEPQFKVSLDVNGIHIANHYVDFMVYHMDGSKELVEIKGKFLYNADTWRMKRKLLEATYLKENPVVRYTVVVV